jgi:hypothetical protein
MPIFLKGLALQNFRGIGSELQKLHPFREFNFFIGPNNAGKSTVLDFLARFLNPNDAGVRRTPAGLERFAGSLGGNALAAIGIPLDLFVAAVEIGNDDRRMIAEKIASALAEQGVVWLKLQFDRREVDYLRVPPSRDIRSLVDDREMSSLWHTLTGQRGGGVEQHWITGDTAEAFGSSRAALSECQANSGYQTNRAEVGGFRLQWPRPNR